MRFINKSLKAAEGKDINIRFLKDHFSTGTLKFTIPLDKTAYKEYVTNPRYKDIWRNYLCEEQEYLCCYCMRRLNTDSFTAEHVIPQSLKGETDRIEFERYVSGSETAPNIVAGVEYSTDTESRFYASESDIDVLDKMPHVISHQNLLAACNGLRSTELNGCCCNNERGRDYLVPYMLIPDGKDRFKYDVNGIMSMLPLHSSWEKIIATLNGSTLQTIRHIWYMIARNTKYEIRHFYYDVEELQRMMILKTAFKKDNFLHIPQQYRKFAGKIMGQGNDYTWKLLVDYSWFLLYYRNH